MTLVLVRRLLGALTFIRARLRFRATNFLVARICAGERFFFEGFRRLRLATIFFTPSHALHDQYVAVNMSFAASHLNRARNLALCFALPDLIAMPGSPKRTSLTLSPRLARTANFLFFPGVLLGVL